MDDLTLDQSGLRFAKKILKWAISIGAIGSIIVLALAFWIGLILGFVYICANNLK